LRKAIEDGQVVKSAELSSVVIIAAGAMALWLSGAWMVDSTSGFMRGVFTEAPRMSMTPDGFLEFFKGGLTKFFIILGPFLVALTAVGVVVNLAQVGAHISTKPLEPNFDKLNPVNGWKRVFSPTTGVNALRDLLKIAIVGVVSFFAIRDAIVQTLPLIDAPSGEIARQFGRLTFVTVMKVAAALFVLAVLDFVYQKYAWKRRLRMTKQEIKDESKDTEGNPVAKMRVRQAQRELARKRMMQDVPTADVIITNPTHIAVALKYDRGMMDAPVVVAKGQNLIAERIREIAGQAGVPIVENKPLARSLFKMCEVGMSVPASLYRAVAEVLAYVYNLAGKEI